MAWTCKGFRFAGVAAGIKNTGALDLGLIACASPASAAAVFTQNKVRAAPVRLSRSALTRAKGKVRALVVNSGNANACTGPGGTTDAHAMLAHTGAALSVDPAKVLVASTGVIGARLPMPQVTAGIGEAAGRLSARGFDAFAEAILTTDKRAKVARRHVTLGGTRVTLLGCTKGAGMIAPNMATTLTFVVTDAALGPVVVDTSLRYAVGGTYNTITVDGDTSTNDMVLVMASGAAGNKPRVGRGVGHAFADALTDLMDELAHALMADGEGVHHVVTVEVRGARSVGAARKIARTIANSPLVKTAIAGGDPNWGRILCAAGNAGVALSPARLSLHIGDVQVVANGAGIADPDLDAHAAAVMKQPRYPITLDLGAGDFAARYLACDLSHDYVTINADYRT